MMHLLNRLTASVFKPEDAITLRLIDSPVQVVLKENNLPKGTQITIDITGGEKIFLITVSDVYTNDHGQKFIDADECANPVAQRHMATRPEYVV